MNLPVENSGEMTPDADTPTAADQVDTTPVEETPAPDTSQAENTPAPASGQDATPSDDGPQSMEEAINAAFEAVAKPESEPDPAAEAVDKPESEAADEDGEGADTSGEASASEDEDGDQGGELPDPTEDEMEAMRPSVQKRIKQLLAQRNAARTEVETYQPDAQRYHAIRRYMDENSLQDAEVAELFQIGAALKSGDPQRLSQFLDRVQPLVQMALEATGRAVPADLNEQVESGEITEEAARELALHRHAAAQAQAQAERARAEAAQVAGTASEAAMTDAVRAWTARIAPSDPDFGLKTAAMKRIAQGIVAERGRPTSPEAAVQIAQDAYKEATELLGAAAPRQKAKPRPTPSASMSPGRTGVAPAPQSIADVVDAGLRLG